MCGLAAELAGQEARVTGFGCSPRMVELCQARVPTASSGCGRHHGAGGMEEIMKRVPSSARFAAALTVALAAILAVTARPAAADTVPFRASFSGSFTVVDRVCSNGDDHLHFTGAGIATHGGTATIAGDSCLHPDPAQPACLIIDTDATTITAADASTIRFASSGEDCLNRATGQITGSGTYSITGGTGRFDGAGGAGEVSLAAQLMQVTGSEGSGTFSQLSFAGTITT
jgi:hypothetical protein